MRSVGWGWLSLALMLSGCPEWEALRAWGQKYWSQVGRKRVEVTWFPSDADGWLWRGWGIFQNWLQGQLPEIPLHFQTRSSVEATFSPRMEVILREIRLQDLPISELRWRWERPRWGLVLSPSGWSAFHEYRWPLEVVLREEDLQSYLNRRAPGSQALRLRLEPGRLVGETTVLLFGVPMPLRLEASLRWQKGQQLFLHEPRITLNGNPIPSAWSEPWLKTINPLFDTHRDLNSPFPILWEEAILEEGRLRLKGFLTLGPRGP